MNLKSAVLASGFALAAMAPTQSMAALERGDFSLGLYGMLMSTGNTDTAAVAVSAGVFLTPHLEISGDLGIDNSYTETQTVNPYYGYTETSWTDTTTRRISLGLDYYILSTSRVLPFIGGGFTYSTTDTETNTDETSTDFSSIMAEAGIRIAAQENVDIDLRLRQIMPTDDQYDDITMFLAGIKLRF